MDDQKEKVDLARLYRRFNITSDQRAVIETEAYLNTPDAHVRGSVRPLHLIPSKRRARPNAAVASNQISEGSQPPMRTCTTTEGG